MSEFTGTLCEYHVLENGIHEFVMLEFSRVGVDAFAEKIIAMNATLSPDAAVPLLIDSSRGTQPVNYLMTRMREINRTSPRFEERGRIALIHQPGVIVAIVDSMMRIFPAVRVRIFSPDEREAAIHWLQHG
jgi:hypothetical protein